MTVSYRSQANDKRRFPPSKEWGVSHRKQKAKFQTRELLTSGAAMAEG
ncbi:hypothetical protein [Desulfogranum marinum]|jgi:hypothetical protein|nr:hypothetical protein [Desulfogranum marinum]MBM9512049.1 hypothetical protein [Desulfogranum marinum]